MSSRRRLGTCLVNDANIKSYVDALLGDDQGRSVAVRKQTLTHEEATTALALAGSDAVWLLRLAKGLPDTFLVEVAADERDEIREAVAGKAALRRLPSVVASLAEDRSPEVRAALVRNRKVPLAAISRLKHDSDENVAWLVGQRLEDS